MSTQPLKLKPGIIYGPVNSRRLGSSLGLNILPFRFKACSFNCLYCQYGFTGARGHIVSLEEREFPSESDVTYALEEVLNEYPLVSYLTFSGNGEPTLHPRFSRIVDAVKNVRDRFNPEIKVAILSNSALIGNEEVREGLKKLDIRYMKLDVGDEALFQRFNRPHPEVDFETIIEGLRVLGDITIQSLFAGGPNGNAGEEAVNAWISRIAEIKPQECHIYSLDRPAADRTLTPLNRDDLESIKYQAEKISGVTVKVFER
jgi:wyosine [tRNA(Phe)-imidazoG37] synthetase (radical SAM superfamily)